MTREEAISIMNVIVHMLEPQYDTDRIEDAVEMAIQALENHETFMKYAYSQGKHDALSQEPCDDAISRDMALEKMADYVASGYADSAEDFEEYSKIICQLPSVTQKSGKWITDRCDMYICSKCKHTYTDLSGECYGMNFCPNCGAKMESEDKE